MAVKLPEPPPRIGRLPKDERGYPIPWFCAWLKDGKEVARASHGSKADFRVLASGSREKAVRQSLCWVCGDRMGRHQVFPIGPMCAINRTTMEPPCHRACAEYSVIACPFLTVPARRRNEAGMGDMDLHVAGDMIERNPGATCLWESSYRPFKVHNGWLIRLETPTRVDWWTKGRQATRAEIEAAIDAGYPSLMDVAKAESQEAVDELEKLRRDAMRLLPAAA
jgi:hypothetical protein